MRVFMICLLGYALSVAPSADLTLDLSQQDDRFSSKARVKKSRDSKPTRVATTIRLKP